MHEPLFAERDPFGLTADDWLSFLGHGPEHYTGPALLWWALVGGGAPSKGLMKAHAFSDLLISLAADASALATLATSSRDPPVRALAPALTNLHHRIAAAAEIAYRIDTDDVVAPATTS